MADTTGAGLAKCLAGLFEDVAGIFTVPPLSKQLDVSWPDPDFELGLVVYEQGSLIVKLTVDEQYSSVGVVIVVDISS